MKAKRKTSFNFVQGKRTVFDYAVAVVQYWNCNQFDGRFKTLQTERAEAVLRSHGIDPSGVRALGV